MVTTTPAPPRTGVVDARPRTRRLALPLAAAAGVAAACAYVYAVDPNEPGHFPPCPIHALLGIDCPGCGGLRGMHALLHGDVAGALDHNLLLAVLVPGAIVLWAVWLRRAWMGRRPARTPDRARRERAILLAVLVAVLAFMVVRNLVPYLGAT